MHTKKKVFLTQNKHAQTQCPRLQYNSLLFLQKSSDRANMFIKVIEKLNCFQCLHFLFYFFAPQQHPQLTPPWIQTTSTSSRYSVRALRSGSERFHKQKENKNITAFLMRQEPHNEPRGELAYLHALRDL